MVTSDMLSLYGPPALIAFALAWGLGRIFYLASRENISVLSFLARKKTPDEIGLGIIAVIFDGYLVLRPFVPQLDDLVWALPSPVPVFGVLLMALGIGLMVISQIDMGRAWRIGVPEELEASQSLITGGLYQFSRNPIYVAILMFLIGGAVVAPGPLTIGSVIGTFILLGPIIRREEAFMAAHFGEAYQRYCSSVRRWI